MTKWVVAALVVVIGLLWPVMLLAQVPPWEADNPLAPLPRPPRGLDSKLTDLKEPPTPERVRLGRWLFYDKRLSADGTVACATCHRPEYAFSEPTPVPTGIKGRKGRRKAPPLLNLAWTLYPHFFWDGRARSLEEQALDAIANPTEMGNPPERLVRTVSGIPGYAKYFKEAFGTPDISKERIARAVADYVRTRMSANSRWERWGEENENVSAKFRDGEELFSGKARCNQCHLGQSFTDNTFHNTGIGWNPNTRTFADAGRYGVTKARADMGSFKTPTLREVSKHAPYMHDGSMKTPREVVLHYNKGGNRNPYLDPKISPLNLTDKEIEILVDFLEALDGQGYQDKAPTLFPR